MRFSQSIPFAMPAAREDFAAATEDEVRPESSRIREDEAAFREFYKQTAPRLRAYVRRASGDAALADDIVQEAFYRFLRWDARAAERWEMRAYVYRAANSLLVDHWRREKRERRRRLLWPLGKSEAAEERKDEGETMRIFRRLDRRQQTLLWLAYVEGFEHREIAAAMRLSERSVRVLLFRARKKLREIAEKEGRVL